MARFSNPFSQYFSDSGRILPGAQLFFYVNGTTTPQATYADAAFTVVNPNPVICGTNGRVPDIYMPGNLVYSITLTDTNGVQIDQADDITGSDSRVSSSDVIAALAANTDPVVINGSSATINADTTIDGTLDVVGQTTLTGDVTLGGDIYGNDASGSVTYAGGSAAANGFNIVMNGSAATDARDGVFRANTAEILRWDNSELHWSFPFDIAMNSGRGIDFSAAGGDVFDYYESGTWTPTYTTNGTDFTSVTYNFQLGVFFRFGDLVVAWCNIRTSAITVGGATGNIRIAGLPFTVGSATAAVMACGTRTAFIDNNAFYNVFGDIGQARLSFADSDNNQAVVADMGTGAFQNQLSFVAVYSI